MTADEPVEAGLSPERIEQIQREVAAEHGQRYPQPKHWKRAAALRGWFSVWPAPKFVWRWIDANSLHFPDYYDRKRRP